VSKSFTRIVRPVLQRVDPPTLKILSVHAWLACERAIDTVVAEARTAA